MRTLTLSSPSSSDLGTLDLQNLPIRCKYGIARYRESRFEWRFRVEYGMV